MCDELLRHRDVRSAPPCKWIWACRPRRLFHDNVGGPLWVPGVMAWSQPRRYAFKAKGCRPRAEVVPIVAVAGLVTVSPRRKVRRRNSEAQS
jgi:hypothetical protein